MSLFNPDLDLVACLEAGGRCGPLLFIAAPGPRGVATVRAVWMGAPLAARRMKRHVRRPPPSSGHRTAVSCPRTACSKRSS